MKGYIYALIDPRIDNSILQIRYIGLTTKKLSQRLSGHICEAKKSNRKFRKINWIKNLINNGYLPQIKEIEQCDISIIKEKEKFYISKYKKMGCKLTNSTDGGEGLFNPSKETREKISVAHKGKFVSEETRKKIGKAQIGRKFSEETRKKISEINKGKKRSKEICEKISKNKKGMCFSEQHKKNLSIAHKGKILTNETKQKMSVSFKGRKISEDHKLKISKSNSGQGNPKAKLLDYQVIEIKKMFQMGAKLKEVMDKYNISKTTASRLKNNIGWAYINMTQ